MADMTRLQQWRDALQEAAFNGLRTVRDSNGEEVTYRSQSEMRSALAQLDSEIARLQRARTSIIRIQASKGV